MAQHDVWFAIPSASPERCRKILPKWRERGYKVAVLQNVEQGDIPADIAVWSDTYPGWGQSINILAKKIVPSDAAIVVSGGCDMLPDPHHTAQELAEQFYTRFPDGFGVMQPHGDTYMEAAHYCGSPFLGRRWIDAMYGGTGPMWGGYRHNWADVELYWVSRCLGALWSRPDLSHFHDHIYRDPAKQPARPKWRLENVERHDRKDIELYLRRKWLRFPGHAPQGIDRPFNVEELIRDTVWHPEKYYEKTYGSEVSGTHAEQRLTAALASIAREQGGPVAIYGSGFHTHQACASLASPPVEVRCVIDDEPSRQEGRLWGFPVVSRERALAMGVRTVVLSSDAHEGTMWDRCADLADAGVKIVRLYDPLPAEKVRRVAAALDACARGGHRRVAIFGAGAHTRDAAEALASAPAPIVCIIDDDKRGQSLAGLPVVDLSTAAKMGLDAVILSSNTFEDAMWTKTEGLRRAGIRVIRLYAQPSRTSHAIEPKPMGVAV